MKPDKCKGVCEYINGKCSKRETIIVNGEKQELGNTKNINKLNQQLAILMN